MPKVGAALGRFVRKVRGAKEEMVVEEEEPATYLELVKAKNYSELRARLEADGAVFLERARGEASSAKAFVDAKVMVWREKVEAKDPVAIGICVAAGLIVLILIVAVLKPLFKRQKKTPTPPPPPPPPPKEEELPVPSRMPPVIDEPVVPEEKKPVVVVAAAAAAAAAAPNEEAAAPPPPPVVVVAAPKQQEESLPVAPQVLVVPKEVVPTQEEEEEEEEAPLPTQEEEEEEEEDEAPPPATQEEGPRKEEEEVVKAVKEGIPEESAVTAVGVEEEKKMEREDTILDLSELPRVPSMTSVSSMDPIGEVAGAREEPSGPPLGSISAAGDVGQRKAMEDVYLGFAEEKLCGGLVCDGAGGSRAAQVVARVVDAHFKKARQVDAMQLRDALRRAEATALQTAARSGKWPDATTAVVGAFDESKILVGWVGDSVALLIKKNKQVKFLTTPHCADNKDEANRIKKSGGRVGRSEAEAAAGATRKLVGKLAPAAAFGARKSNPKRIYPGGITLTRALGGLPLKYSRPKLVLADPEFATLRREPDDFCLLLASDGLLEKLSPSEIVDNLIANKDAHAIVHLAAANHTKDNIAAVCCFFP